MQPEISKSVHTVCMGTLIILKTYTRKNENEHINFTQKLMKLVNRATNYIYITHKKYVLYNKHTLQVFRLLSQEVKANLW